MKTSPTPDRVSMMERIERQSEYRTLIDNGFIQCPDCMGAGYKKAYFYGGNMQHIETMAAHHPEAPLPVHIDECNTCRGAGANR